MSEDEDFAFKLVECFFDMLAAVFALRFAAYGEGLAFTWEEMRLSTSSTKNAS